MLYTLQIIVNSEGKNATTLIRVHIDPDPKRKPETTTLRSASSTRKSGSSNRATTTQRERIFKTENVEVFKSTSISEDPATKNDNLESENHQAFAFSVKENRARKCIGLYNELCDTKSIRFQIKMLHLSLQ